ncbi:MAG TPA: amino acid permease [Anaerolineales bacterium]|nr:amino acid permease [Anaerolineae bacterium]HIQ01063.1 amino acid permease [Anaerolineales bacterium]
MPRKQLVRTLGLAQILMLGIGGTMGAGVFVLTGHAAGLVGPAVILVFLLAGLQSLPNSLSYAELASSFPVAGGGYAYISKATTGILPFSVGWVSWFSSMVYAALSAVGAAYSLKIFLPFLPIPLTAVGFIALFTLISLRGSQEAGRTQLILAGFLLGSLGLFVILGLILPGGFSWATFNGSGGFFIYEGTIENMVKIFQAVTMVNVLFVGYEVIATTAEEAKEPGRNIPVAVVGTIFICALVYCAVAFVALGILTIPQLAASSVPLSAAAANFLGGWGPPLLGLAGMVATVTSLNTASLSSARVALALSRDGYLPAFLSRVHPRLKTPLPAILVSGAFIALAAISGDEVFLSYVSNFGYMFVVFFTNVSVILLRRKFPNVERAFRTPWYPVTPILGCLGIIVVEVFTELHALVVGIGLIGVGLIVYQLRRPVGRVVEVAAQTVEAARHEILVPVANPLTARGLIRMAVILGRAREESTLAALSVVKIPGATPLELAQEMLDRGENGRKMLLKQVADYAHEQGVPVRPLLRAARSVSSGILGVAEARGGVGMILMGWRGQLSTQRVAGSVVKDVVYSAKCDVAVLRDRGIEEGNSGRVLVPVGGGPHARLALKLGWDIARAEGGSLTALRILPESGAVDMEVEMEVLRQLVEDVLEETPESLTFRLRRDESVVGGILAEAAEGGYDLVAIGASEEWFLRNLLFGSIPDRVADGAGCSVLMVRKYEPAAVSWLRRTIRIGGW